MSLTNLLVLSFAQMLRRLSAWLDKATAQARVSGTDENALLSKRLAPDMYPLSAQIRFACFFAQEAVFRLKGESVPETLEQVRREGWNGGEQPGLMVDAQARISEALALLDALGSTALDGDVERPIALELPSGPILDLTAEQYARDWALAEFYFHLITAYAILRNQGIELGKLDYISHMLVYLRTGSRPQS